MTSPSAAWDLIPVFGIYLKADGVTPEPGSVQLTLMQRVNRVDGRVIHPEGAKVTRTIGDHDSESAIRDAVRNAWRTADEAAVVGAGGTFDGAAWDARWAVMLTGAVFASFPASDDPDIVQTGYQVKVEEKLNSGSGKVYFIQPLLADLASTPPGINLGLIDVPPGSPTAPAPIYQKGQPGGVAALDLDGDVIDASGAKVTGGTGGTGGSAVALDADGTLTVDGVTVEVATDGQLTAEATARASADSALDARLDTLETSAPGAASTTAAGLVELATNTEALAGTDAARAVTPAALEGVLVEERTQQSATYATQTALATNATDDRARANHTGTQSLDTTTDSATRLALTSAERTKLTGVATGATANSSDTTLLARANHTGSQAISTVTGLQADLDTRVASATIDNIVVLTQAAYDALTPVATTLYVIEG